MKHRCDLGEAVEVIKRLVLIGESDEEVFAAIAELSHRVMPVHAGFMAHCTRSEFRWYLNGIYEHEKEELRMKKESGKIIDFGENFHPEFTGWIAEDGEGIWVSMIMSKQKGKGNFVRLLDELKAKYSFIKIPTASIEMIKICLKREFVLKHEYFPEPFNEMGDVLVWQKAINNKGDLIVKNLESLV